jgi:isochorismate synthase
MINRDDFAPFIDKLLEKNCSFALWSEPGSDEFKVLITDKKDLIYPAQFDKLNGQEGFVFAPYRISDRNPLILLKPGIYKTGIDQILNIDLDEIPDETELLNNPDDLFPISKDQYLTDVEKTIQEIKDTKLAKVIVSRMIPESRKSESLGELYQQLFNQTPNAFVYLVNLPKAGLWMGATPEILLQSEGKNMETVSLAGTQPRSDNSDYGWHTKEIEEQAFVSRYMLDIFFRFNIHHYTTQGPETMESGKVAHLKTSFHFSAKKIKDRLGEFIAEFHPTPAVCGLPKSKADRFISKIEKHDRRYYTGYLGSWRLEDSVRLFVNLRCMEILPKEYILYSGGGITSRSVPEKEWEETNNKARTLLSAIEAIQNK